MLAIYPIVFALGPSLRLPEVCKPQQALGRRSTDHPACAPAPPGLKAFRQQLRKNARTKGLLGLNKIKGLARQVCQPSSSRASRGGLSSFQLPAQSPGLHGSGVSSREGRSLLEEVLHQQRYARLAPVPLAAGGLPDSWVS